MNYIYHTTGSLEQNTIAEELDKLDNTFLQPVIALECIKLTATYLCNYYFPSCGSQEGVHLPVSICSRECNFVQARYPHMWNFIDTFLSQYTNLEMITCTNITAKFSGISPCCSGLDIDVILTWKKNKKKQNWWVAAIVAICLRVSEDAEMSSVTR